MHPKPAYPKPYHPLPGNRNYNSYKRYTRPVAVCTVSWTVLGVWIWGVGPAALLATTVETAETAEVEMGIRRLTQGKGTGTAKDMETMKKGNGNGNRGALETAIRRWARTLETVDGIEEGRLGSMYG
ncbi:hypothetical protein BZA77DRAFT_350590 [Pyronema omphalodes]|nr:hypothetical protein BZA77DRAFT_350590 [Pyronema omphalodes]